MHAMCDKKDNCSSSGGCGSAGRLGATTSRVHKQVRVLLTLDCLHHVQTNEPTNIQANRHTYRPTNTQIGTHTYRQTNTQTGTHTYIQANRHTYRHTCIDTYMQSSFCVPAPPLSILLRYETRSKEVTRLALTFYVPRDPAGNPRPPWLRLLSFWGRDRTLPGLWPGSC